MWGFSGKDFLVSISKLVAGWTKTRVSLKPYHFIFPVLSRGRDPRYKVPALPNYSRMEKICKYGLSSTGHFIIHQHQTWVFPQRSQGREAASVSSQMAMHCNLKGCISKDGVIDTEPHNGYANWMKWSSQHFSEPSVGHLSCGAVYTHPDTQRPSDSTVVKYDAESLRPREVRCRDAGWSKPELFCHIHSTVVTCMGLPPSQNSRRIPPAHEGQLCYFVKGAHCAFR